MALPLLFVVARSYDFASLGPFGDAWWMTPILVSAGRAAAPEGELPPSRTYAEPLLPPRAAGDNPVGAEPHRWASTIFSAVTERPDPGLPAFLDSLARHPAHEAFSGLARAPAIDVAAGRWSGSALRPRAPKVTCARCPGPPWTRA